MSKIADTGTVNETCESCCYRFGEECRFASPVGRNGELSSWPRIRMTDWCGRYKLERKKPLRATESSIISIMDVIGEAPYEEFVQLVAKQFGIHPRSAGIKVERLLMRHKLDEVEGGRISLGRPRKMGRPKKDEVARDEDAPVEERSNSAFGKWRKGLEISFGTLEDAGMFSDLREIARVNFPISNAAFSTMLKRAMEAGELIKTDEKKYWLQPIAREPTTPAAAPDGIEVP